MFNGRAEKILVIKTDTLAGFVLAEPVFEQIRRSHPEATISLLTTKSLERLARAAPFFDQIAALPDIADRAQRQALVTQVRRSKFSRVYDLCNSDASRKLYKGLFGFSRPKWHSVQSSRGTSFGRRDDVVVPDMDRFFSSVGFEEPERRPNFSWALEGRKDSANMRPSWYGLTGAYGLFLPNKDERRRMSAEQYAKLANQMVENHITPVLIGDHSLHDFGDDISMLAPELVDLSGKSDHLQLAALARHANFFISDHADELYLALSMGCDGVLISPDPEILAASQSSSHIVHIRAHGSSSQLSHEQIWQTVRNMGVLNVADQPDHHAMANYASELQAQELTHPPVAMPKSGPTSTLIRRPEGVNSHQNYGHQYEDPPARLDADPYAPRKWNA